MHIALRNCGYRFLEESHGVYTFGKPLGYGILRADFRPGDTKIDIMLIVKGNTKNGKRPNLIWQRCFHDILSEHEDFYLNCVQAIKDSEAEIFAKSSVAILDNRFVRYDFEGNSSLGIDKSITNITTPNENDTESISNKKGYKQ